ncbi:aspartate aminotransferase family protein [Desulfohalovibrio reitneri]|uniref:aspartate aminotransferase family protein n=1 Tax=Desulfohalovibrio reitneri TaxID=1307759 RepID=UPI0004A6F703|nr:aspartate aminotransferase family protein [Desulfohalovibrio reitneri]
MADLPGRREEAVARGVTSGPLGLARGEGARLWDENGREYLDFNAGIAVMALGHSHPRVVEAVRRQAGELQHVCFHTALYEGYVALAERLCGLYPGGGAKAALFNSGAEAVENAVKTARRATGKQAVVAFDHAFHGRTLLSMALTGLGKTAKTGFGPYPSDIHHVPFATCAHCPLRLEYPDCGVACAEMLDECFRTRVSQKDTACVVVEPVLGGGGFHVPPPEWLPRIAEICRAHGVLLVADEIQSGLGRTGRMWACDHYGVVPDLICTAKALGGGLPVSGLVGRAEVMDAVEPGGLGSTFGGNPVACAAALAVLDVLDEENLPGRAARLGGEVAARLRQAELPHAEPRGLGLLRGLAVSTPDGGPDGERAKRVVAACREAGLLTSPCGLSGDVVRTLPPLTIPEEELARGLDVLVRAAREA